MKAMESPGGLCLTCVHAQKCALPAAAGRSVVYCEEFATRAEAEHPVPATRPRSTLPGGGERPVEGRLGGLCMNCLKVASCTFPVQEGGVWHCEEYE